VRRAHGAWQHTLKKNSKGTKKRDGVVRVDLKIRQEPVAPGASRNAESSGGFDCLTGMQQKAEETERENERVRQERTAFFYSALSGHGRKNKLVRVQPADDPAIDRAKSVFLE